MVKKDELTVIEKEVSPILREAKELSIETTKDMSKAAEMLSGFNKILDRITDEKEKVTKPLNAALAAERKRWKPQETLLETAIGLIRSKMGQYQTKQIEATREEEAKLASRVGPGKGKFTTETAIRKMGEIERPDAIVNTEAGAVKFREVKKFEVMDITMLPSAYLIPDEDAIKDAMKRGVELPGVRYFTEQVPVNYR